MEKDKTLKECLEYFKERPIYTKLFRMCKDKYAGLGRLGGTVNLGDISKEDRSLLGGFFQRDFHGVKRVSITAQMLEVALANSRFSSLTWEEILEAFDQKPLVINREVKNKSELQRKNFFDDILILYAEEGKRWLSNTLEERGSGYQSLMQHYKEDAAYLKELLVLLDQTIRILPYKKQSTELLAVFAANVTGNPHFYDEGTPGYGLLSSYLRFTFAELKLQGLSGPEKRNKRLFAAGIIKDELSNYTTVYGIHARKEDKSIHSGIEGYYKMQEPVQVSLWTLGTLAYAWADLGQSVYVLENPAVFARLIRRYPHITAVCSNGQPRLATLLLLDFLVQQGLLYYAGDFDPEGLLIAQRLKERYGERLRLWKYETVYYEKYLSNVILDSKRMKKLVHVTEPQLQGIKSAMTLHKKAAYQETMLEVLLEWGEL